MKQLFKHIACLVALGMVLALSAPFAALAAEAPYTYTVTLSMGRQGTYSHAGVAIGLRDPNVLPTWTENDGLLTITNLAAGSRVTLTQDAANVDPNGKYYVKGVRISGRDNNTATAPSFVVNADADYVMAYGVKGDLTQYTVHYQDTNGNALAPSRSYYGNVGDKPVVAYLYIDGYRPQSYNLTKTLVANSAENVFTFVYGRTNGTGGTGGTGGGNGGGDSGNGGGGGTGDNGGGGGIGPGGATPPPPQDIIIYIPLPVTPDRPTARPATTGNGGSSDNGDNNNENADNNGENADENADGEGETQPEEIVQELPAPDQNAANGAGGNGANGANGGTGDEAIGNGTPEELTDIDANRTPLANLLHQIAQTVSNASPVALAGGGIVLAGLVGLLLFLLFVRKKKKDEEEASDEHSRH